MEQLVSPSLYANMPNTDPNSLWLLQSERLVFVRQKLMNVYDLQVRHKERWHLGQAEPADHLKTWGFGCTKRKIPSQMDGINFSSIYLKQKPLEMLFLQRGKNTWGCNTWLTNRLESHLDPNERQNSSLTADKLSEFTRNNLALMKSFV